MDVTPVSGSRAKRARAKAGPKVDVAKPVRKTLTTTRKQAPPALKVVDATPDMTLDLNGLIATTAFYLAAERNFAPGHELDDWLEAERRVRAKASA